MSEEKQRGKRPEDVDLTALEAQYRANVLPLRALAKQYGVGASTIVKWAERFDWERDLGAKIRAKADAAVNKAVVNKSVNTESRVSERETVEANALAVADIRLSHRSDIRRGRDLVAKLVAEVGVLTDRPALVQEMTSALADLEGADSVKGLRDAIDRVMSLPGRVTSAKGLAEALKNLVALERQAWNMDAESDGTAATGRELSDLERASRLASILDRARRAKAETSND
jgi:transposase